MVDICIASKFIDFNDPDEGYEEFTAYLRQTEFDWEKASEYGYELVALAELAKDDLRVFATSTLEAKQLTTEGEIPVAYDVYSAIYETLGQLRQAIYDQLETDMEVTGMSLAGADKQELTMLFSKP